MTDKLTEQIEKELDALPRRNGTTQIIQEREYLRVSLISARHELEEAKQNLQNKAAEKMPHSLVKMKWACGHEGGAACVQCFDDKCSELRALKSPPEGELVIDWDEIRVQFEAWYVLAVADEIRSEVTQSTEKIRELVVAQLKGE